MEAEKLELRELENFYVNGTIEDVNQKIEQLKEQKVNEIIKYAKDHEKEILNKDGDVVGHRVECNPLVVSNIFFKSICPLSNAMPKYNAEKLGMVYDYYTYLVTEVNEKIGNYPSSLANFCKLAGITTRELAGYKRSSDYDMRVVVEKIYDDIGNDNITLSQMGRAKETSTLFKLKTQNEIVEKTNPNINISYKEIIDTTKLNTNLEKYKKLLEKSE